MKSMINIKTKFNIIDILKSLEANAKTHFDEYCEADKAYRVALKKKVKDTLRLLNNEEMLNDIFFNYGLKRPINNFDEYHKLIEIFRTAMKSGEKTVELGTNEANCIFNDDWDWNHEAKSINTSYLSAQLRR